MESGLLQTFAENPALFIGICGVLGLMIGSFLNVVIHRLPIMMDNELRAECAALAAEDAPSEAEPAVTETRRCNRPSTWRRPKAPSPKSRTRSRRGRALARTCFLQSDRAPLGLPEMQGTDHRHARTFP